MRSYPLVLVLALGLPAGCGGGQSGGNEVEAAPAGEVVQVDLSVHDLKCGCAIEEVGACAPYADIDGELVELTASGDVELGPHEFCGKEGLKAELAGQMVDGKLVASSFSYVE